MTNEEIRSDPELVKRMREMFESTPFLLLLEAMRREDPVKFPPSADVTPHYAHIQLGQQTGYATYEARMLSLGTRLPPPQTTPPADYRPEPDQE